MRRLPMEAGTGGSTPQEQLQAALNRLAGAVGNMQGRVNSDLTALRQQVDELNAEHDEIDLTEIMVQIDSIISVVARSTRRRWYSRPSRSRRSSSRPRRTAGHAAGRAAAGEQPPAAEEPPVGDETGDTGAVVGDQGEQADAPPLYVYDGDVSQTDTGAFSPAGVSTPDGQPLFTYRATRRAVRRKATTSAASGTSTRGRPSRSRLH
jgi:hypothetical protein